MSTSRQRAFLYLKQRATEAHRSGDVGTVRHLSYVALEHLLTEKEPRALPEDVSWAFTYSIYWMKRPSELDASIGEAFKKLQHGDAPHALLLGFLIRVLEFNSANLEEDHRTLYDLDISRVAQNPADPTPDGLLLSMVIEFLWILDRQGDSWVQIGQAWIRRLPEGSWMRMSVESVVRRLRRISQILYVGAQSSEPVAVPGTIGLLANCWDAFYAQDFPRLEDLVPELAQAAPFSSENFLAAQGLLSMAKSAQWDFSAHNGSYRYDRALMSRPVAVIHNLRLAAFDELLGEARQREMGSGQTRRSLLRLVWILELAALRTMDLRAYLGVTRCKRDLFAEIGTFEWERNGVPGRYANELLQAVVEGVRALGWDRRSETEQDLAVRLLEVADKSSLYVHRLVTALTNLRPTELPYAVKPLEVLGDAYPEDRLPDLMNFTTRLLDSWARTPIRLRYAPPVGFWAPIVEHCDIPANIWSTLGGLIVPVAALPHNWSTYEGLLTAFLARGPEPIVLPIADRIIAAEVNDYTDEDYRSAILYNAALRNTVLRPLVTEYLRRQAADRPDEIAIRVHLVCLNHLVTDASENNGDEQQVREELVRQFVHWCRELKPEAPGVYSYTVQPLANHFRKLSWRDVPTESMNLLLDVTASTLKLQRLSDRHATAIIKALLGVANRSSDSVRRRILAITLDLVDNPPDLHSHESVIKNDGGPFSNFHMSFGGRHEFQHFLLAIVALLYPFAEHAIKRRILDWGIAQVLDLKDVDAQHWARLFFYSVLQEDFSADGQTGLAILSGQRHDSDTVAAILNAFSVVVNESEGSDDVPTANRLSKIMARPVAFSWISKWLEQCAYAPQPESRVAAAKVLKVHPELRSILPNGEVLAARLRSDPRSRVRNVWPETDAQVDD